MGTKQFDNYADLITFTRASGGTALRPISYGSELVTNGTFDADVSGWIAASDNSGSPTFTFVGGAGRLNSDTGINGFNQAFSTVVGKTYIASGSASIVSGTPSAIRIRKQDVSTTNVTLGNPVNIVDSEETATVVFVATATTTYIHLQVNGTATVDFDNISVKEVLFDQPNAPLTLFNHPTNIPRIEYDADGNRLGLLIEEQRTNLLTYSEDFSDSDWTKNDSSIQSNVIISPDGTLTGDKIVENTNTTWHGVSQPSASLTSGTTYTATFFVKKAERSIVQILFSSSTHGLSAYANFDILNGVLGTVSGGTASITNIGNNWYRISYSSTATSTATGGALCAIVLSTTSARVQSYTGDGTSGIYIWGAQLEAGAFPTSYIPTSGSTATRAADVASIPTSAFGYNASEGTVVVDFEAAETGTNNTALAFSNTVSGSFTDQILIWNAANSNGYVLANGVTQAQFGNPTDQNGQVKISFAFKKNDFAISYDGNSVVTDTSGIMPSNIEVMKIGDWTNSGQRRILNGTIKSIKYYPRRLSDAQLQELTQ